LFRKLNYENLFVIETGVPGTTYDPIENEKVFRAKSKKNQKNAWLCLSHSECGQTGADVAKNQWKRKIVTFPNHPDVVV